MAGLVPARPTSLKGSGPLHLSRWIGRVSRPNAIIRSRWEVKPCLCHRKAVAIVQQPRKQLDLGACRGTDGRKPASFAASVLSAAATSPLPCVTELQLDLSSPSSYETAPSAAGSSQVGRQGLTSPQTRLQSSPASAQKQSNTPPFLSRF